MTLTCKRCGGMLQYADGDAVTTCPYCESRQTLPRLGSDRRANLYDRANHFLRGHEFDKATAIYEQILNEDSTDAEAYWSLVLCRFGIEYVEDPATKKRVPTVNRTQTTSILADENYRSAIRCADGARRALYEEEAAVIAEIQRGILDISQREEPFDVFICYKETDENGRRTHDSVLAQEIYYQLVGEGFKVFFSRITLEDKLGAAYEPYIFAALQSAKVMVAVGTKPAYFQAVWVRNEWIRYLSLVQNSGGKKVLIPAYRDMDPYDLPEEFSHLQGQDMSKLGFMQDLVRGIKKILGRDRPTPAPERATERVVERVVEHETTGGGHDISPLLERAVMALEDGEFDRAREFCEQVLNQEPKCAEAYLYELMAALRCKRRASLRDQAEPFHNLTLYGRVMRYGNADLQSEMRGCIAHIEERNAEAVRSRAYEEAVLAMRAASTEEGYRRAAGMLFNLGSYRDAEELREQCLRQADEARERAAEAQRNQAYEAAVLAMRSASTEDGYRRAAGMLFNLGSYRDAEDLREQCLRQADEARERAAEARWNQAYEEAVRVMRSAYKEANCRRAAALFSNLGSYRDAEDLREQCLRQADEAREQAAEAQRNQAYEAAVRVMRSASTEADYRRAVGLFANLGAYRDASQLRGKCIRAAAEAQEAETAAVRQGAYQKALRDMKRAKKVTEYEAAARAFRALGNYEDSPRWAAMCEKIITLKSNVDENRNQMPAVERDIFALEQAMQNLRNSSEEEIKRERKIRRLTIICLSIIAVVAVVMTIFVKYMAGTSGDESTDLNVGGIVAVSLLFGFSLISVWILLSVIMGYKTGKNWGIFFASGALWFIPQIIYTIILIVNLFRIPKKMRVIEGKYGSQINEIITELSPLKAKRDTMAALIAEYNQMRAEIEQIRIV